MCFKQSVKEKVKKMNKKVVCAFSRVWRRSWIEWLREGGAPADPALPLIPRFCVHWCRAVQCSADGQ